jgi:hypothetical protein
LGGTRQQPGNLLDPPIQTDDVNVPADLCTFPRTERAASNTPATAWIWDRIVAAHGVVRIDALAAELGWSRKRLWTRFQHDTDQPEQHPRSPTADPAGHDR